MNRSTALTYLQSEYLELATEAKFTDVQIIGAYNNAIDMSMRYLGVAETDLQTTDVSQTSVLVYIALMNYFALLRIQRIFSLRFDVIVAGAINAKRSQLFAQMKELLADAEQQCANLGVPIGSGAFSLGRVELDYLEPGKVTYEEFIW